MEQNILEKEVNKLKLDIVLENPEIQRIRKLDNYYSSLPSSWFFDPRNLSEFNKYLEKRKEYLASKEDNIFLRFE